jgi:hypothetical protein
MFRYSVCDPLKKDPIEMGEIEKGKILEVLDKFPWIELLNKMNGADEKDICFSPSIEFENKDTRHGLAISIVGEEKEYEFYIFYKRPKMMTKMFGLVKEMNENYTSDRTGQTLEDVKRAVTALISDDVMTLEKGWG